MTTHAIRSILLLSLSLAVSLACLSGETAPIIATVILKDKTQLVGEIRELKDGVYRVRTSALGEVLIKADQVARIEYPDETRPRLRDASASAEPAKPAASAAPPALGQADQITALFGFETILKNLMGDPELMQKVQKLAEDPEFVAILDDPQIRKAIEDGNFVALSRHPKIWGLLNHPTVKGIAREVQANPSVESAE